MNRQPYAKLAAHYDLGWGDFAESCRGFIRRTLAEGGIDKGRILELACGTGILATHLALLGYTVVGVDRSLAMIDVARRRGAYVPRVEFYVGDMRIPKAEPPFDGALCLFDSLNYLTERVDVKAMLQSASACLRKGGTFIFDFNRPHIYAVHDGQTLRRRIDGGTLTQELHYESSSRMARTVFRFPDGDVEIHLQRAYETDEILPLVKAAGLTVRGSYSGFSRRPLSSLSERVVCVCQKS